MLWCSRKPPTRANLAARDVHRRPQALPHRTGRDRSGTRYRQKDGGVLCRDRRSRNGCSRKSSPGAEMLQVQSHQRENKPRRGLGSSLVMQRLRDSRSDLELAGHALGPHRRRRAQGLIFRTSWPFRRYRARFPDFALLTFRLDRPASAPVEAGSGLCGLGRRGQVLRTRRRRQVNKGAGPVLVSRGRPASDRSRRWRSGAVDPLQPDR